MIDTIELRKLTQAATSGEWYVKRGNYIYGRNEVTDGEEVWYPVIACTDDDEVNVNFEANAAFIAAANPAAISELLDRLEAAEKDSAHHKALAESALRVAKGWEDKCDELRAKIAEMEQQEPARLVTATAYRWRYRGAVKWQYGELTEETARRAKEHNHEVQPLYALPGAQPAPSVPDGWLRAIDEALVTAHIGVADENDTYEQAKAKLDNLIGFFVDVATDPAVNGGWKLVPIEPTREMLRAGEDTFVTTYTGTPVSAPIDVYRAMLAAAPEAKP